MGVRVGFAIRDGWKATENNRFGQVLEFRWINEADGKVMFRYAPCLEDKIIFQEGFELLEEYDAQLKILRDLVTRIDGRQFKACGTGVKNENA